MSELEVAVKAARAAAEVLREMMGVDLGISYKDARANLVTVADKQSQQVITEVIAGAFPGHAIVGEEGTAGDPGAEPLLVRRPARRHHQLRPRLSLLLRVDRPPNRRRNDSRGCLRPVSRGDVRRDQARRRDPQRRATARLPGRTAGPGTGRRPGPVRRPRRDQGLRPACRTADDRGRRCGPSGRPPLPCAP